MPHDGDADSRHPVLRGDGGKPMCAKSKTNTGLPERPSLLGDTLKPKRAESVADSEDKEPDLATPSANTKASERTMLRGDSEEPACAKSVAEHAEPKQLGLLEGGTASS